MEFKQILFNVEVESKQELFGLIAEIFKQQGVVEDSKEFIRALNEREATVSTGLLNGIAIPHGKSQTVIENEVIMLKLKKPLEYETLDGNDVEFVFALAISEDNVNHVEVLSKLATKLMDDECIEKLKIAKSASEIQEIFKD